MKNIGLIDDKDESRRAFMLKLKLKLEEQYEGWNIIDIRPFPNKEDYQSWILENEISVLITDERLDEGQPIGGKFVTYFGSELVIFLREYFKDLPIYCITNISITDQLKNSLSHFNLILGRSKFDSDIDNYLNLFIKSGISFYTEYTKELSRLGELSEKFAFGKASHEERTELQAIQTRLTLPHLTDELNSREKFLVALEKKIAEIKEMNDLLINQLNKD